MSEEIIAIRNITACNVTAHNGLVIGVPPPTAIAGAALALCRTIGVTMIGTAVIVHDFRMHKGHPKFVPSEANKAASTVDVRMADMRLSLLIKISQSDDLDYEDARLQITRHLRKIAGGMVIEPPDLASVSFHDDIVQAFSARTASNPSIRDLGGVALVDRSDLLAGYPDPLEAILAHIAIPAEGVTKPAKGWLVPIHIGFQAIEPPTHRRCDRKRNDEAIPHVFAEPITSLGEFVAIRRLKQAENCFWRYQHNAMEGTYYVAAR